MDGRPIKFLTLDSLRGIAALTVAIFHFSSDWAGYLAVDFFLVLSGFILSHSYLYRNNAISTTEFISHRMARLYPLHIFTLIIFIFVSIIIHKHFPYYSDGTIFTLIQNITLTQNIGLNPTEITWNHPSWSISVEFWVNIIFILFITKNTKSSTLFMCALLGLFVIHNNTGHLDTHYANYYGFINSGMIRGVSSFFIGILSYRIFLQYRDNTTIKKYINYLEIMCIALIMAVVFFRSGKFSQIDFFAPFVFMLVVPVFSIEAGFLSKPLKWFSYLGTISYSIYLNQVAVLLVTESILNKFDTPLAPTTALTIFLLNLIIYSHFTYIYIEKPLRTKSRNTLSKIFRHS
jgi:peptidoglycan/LPS O-acetylase OafA/YrhL